MCETGRQIIFALRAGYFSLGMYLRQATEMEVNSLVELRPTDPDLETPLGNKVSRQKIKSENNRETQKKKGFRLF